MRGVREDIAMRGIMNRSHETERLIDLVKNRARHVRRCVGIDVTCRFIGSNGFGNLDSLAQRHGGELS